MRVPALDSSSDNNHKAPNSSLCTQETRPEAPVFSFLAGETSKGFSVGLEETI